VKLTVEKMTKYMYKSHAVLLTVWSLLNFSKNNISQHYTSTIASYSQTGGKAFDRSTASVLVVTG